MLFRGLQTIRGLAAVIVGIIRHEGPLSQIENQSRKLTQNPLGFQKHPKCPENPESKLQATWKT